MEVLVRARSGDTIVVPDMPIKEAALDFAWEANVVEGVRILTQDEHDTRGKEQMAENKVPLVEDEGKLMPNIPCVGCGKREGVKMLTFKTSYGMGSNAGRQVIPLCELCSIDLGMQLFHIWNPGRTSA
jgi:hypothetical protein